LFSISRGTILLVWVGMPARCFDLHELSDGSLLPGPGPAWIDEDEVRRGHFENFMFIALVRLNILSRTFKRLTVERLFFVQKYLNNDSRCFGLAWWPKVRINPMVRARALWLKTHPLPAGPRTRLLEPPSQQRRHDRSIKCKAASDGPREYGPASLQSSTTAHLAPLCRPWSLSVCPASSH
jgi:hypothetical protein